MSLSRKFIEKVKLWPVPQYRLANEAGLNPATLSKFLIGAQPAKQGDARLIKLARLIGFPEDQVFKPEDLKH